MSTNITGLGVHIKVKDFSKSLAFYKALGFSQVFAYGPRQKVHEDYNGAVFEHGGAKLEIAAGHRAVKPSVFNLPVPSSKISLMIHVKSLNQIIRLCQKAGISIVVAPRHYYWGTLELVVKDPDGTVLVFITPYSQSETLLINADESFGQNPLHQN